MLRHIYRHLQVSFFSHAPFALVACEGAKIVFLCEAPPALVHRSVSAGLTHFLLVILPDL